MVHSKRIAYKFYGATNHLDNLEDLNLPYLWKNNKFVATSFNFPFFHHHQALLFLVKLFELFVFNEFIIFSVVFKSWRFWWRENSCDKFRVLLANLIYLFIVKLLYSYFNFLVDEPLHYFKLQIIINNPILVLSFFRNLLLINRFDFVLWLAE